MFNITASNVATPASGAIMSTHNLTRRDLLLSLTAIPTALELAAPAASAADNPDSEQEITHTAEAIHQQVVFQASREHVYRALTDSIEFDRVVSLSEAVASGMVPATAKASRISRSVGGAFSVFGGYISGIQVELVRDLRLVQAWRAASWKPGEYSIASFVLADEGSATRLIFDHRGFPTGTAQHLAAGWHGNYWQPLAKLLAQTEN
jgi:activator of HSP90 ATPase